jgi:filamentous hemagglutinin family protein
MTTRSTNVNPSSPRGGAWWSVLAALSCGVAHAGVMLDGSQGPAPTLRGPTYVIGAQSGKSDAKNTVLFHSFSEFNLAVDEKAVFTGPATITNIFARVTSRTASSIQGLIDTATSMPSANFFLLNPAGVVFSGSARLNVGGSFHATTADYVRFADDTKFRADLSQRDFLSVAAPKTFGFLESNAGSITVNGGTLAVAAGKTISLIGKQPTISAGTLSAPGGTIRLANAPPGEVPLEKESTLTVVNDAQSGGHVRRDASQLPDRSIVIRSGRLLLDNANILSSRGGAVSIEADQSAEFTGGEVSTRSSSRPAGEIEISAPVIAIRGGAAIVSRNPSASDPGGAITIDTDTFELSSLASIKSTTAQGPGGNITVTATGSILVSDSAAIVTFSTTDKPAGNVSLNVGFLTLTREGKLQAGTFGTKSGGNLSIVASGSITISQHGGITTQASAEQAVGTISVRTPLLQIDNGYISSSTVDVGRAGDINLNVDSLVLINGGQVATGSLQTSPGRAGDVNVPRAASVIISGSSPDNLSAIGGVFRLDTPNSGIFTTTQQGGEGGDIKLTATRIEMHGGGKIFADSKSPDSTDARAGNIDILFGDTLLVDHSSISTASVLADGGNISIRSTGSVLQLVGGQITTSVRGGGGGGGNITLGSHVHPLGFLALSDSTVDANAFGGPGGNIGIFSDAFLKGNSSVTASSQLSTPGTIDVEARVTDVSDSLAQLPGDLLQAQNLLRAACAARTVQGKTSSLVVAGREGVPPEPGGLLSSPLAALFADASATSETRYESAELTTSPGPWSGSNCAR